MKVVSSKDENGKLAYSTDIVRGVVECALAEIPGVVKYDAKQKFNQKQAKNYIRIDHVDDYLYIDVFIKLSSTVSVPETASKVQSTIKNALETMTEFKVKDINVHIVDVDFTDNQ